MTFKRARLEAAILIVAAAEGGLALFVLTMGSPDLIPMHFDAAGQVDRWGDRTEAAWLIGLFAAITLIGGLVLARSARRADEDRRRGLAFAQMLLLAATAILAAMIGLLASVSLDPIVAGPRIALMGACALFAVIGALLGKVAPNGLVGIRTPWSRASRLAWDRSNRLAGRLFFWTGLAGLLLAPAAPQAEAHAIFIAAVLIIALMSVFESWRVWRTDPDRRNP